MWSLDSVAVSRLYKALVTSPLRMGYSPGREVWVSCVSSESKRVIRLPTDSTVSFLDGMQAFDFCPSVEEDCFVIDIPDSLSASCAYKVLCGPSDE